MMLLSLRTLGPDCTPELHTRAASPSIHVKAAHLSLPQFEESTPTRTCSAATTIKTSLSAISNRICSLVVHVQT
jgi:hypothetical protein